MTSSDELADIETWLHDMMDDSDNECLSLDDIITIQQVYELIRHTQ